MSAIKQFLRSRQPISLRPQYRIIREQHESHTAFPQSLFQPDLKNSPQPGACKPTMTQDHEIVMALPDLIG
jgi:hypothetical protein